MLTLSLFQRNHKQMNAYRIVCIAALVCSVISTGYIVATHTERTDPVKISLGIDFSYTMSPNELLICGITSCVLEAYFFICINSLFLNIKEGLPRNGNRQENENIDQTQKSVETKQKSNQSLPLYPEVSTACFEKVVTSLQPESSNGTAQLTYV